MTQRCRATSRQRFAVNNSRGLALGCFAIGLLAVTTLEGNSTNHVWILAVFAVLAAGIGLTIYSLLVRFRILGVLLPAMQ